MRKPRGSSIVMPVIDPEPAPSLLRFVTLQCVEGEQDLAGLAPKDGFIAKANRIGRASRRLVLSCTLFADILAF